MERDTLDPDIVVFWLPLRCPCSCPVLLNPPSFLITKSLSEPPAPWGHVGAGHVWPWGQGRALHSTCPSEGRALWAPAEGRGPGCRICPQEGPRPQLLCQAAPPLSPHPGASLCLGSRAIWTTQTAEEGSRGPPASQLSPLLLACFLWSLEIHLTSRAGGRLRLITWASTFSTLWQGLDFGNSEGRELEIFLISAAWLPPAVGTEGWGEEERGDGGRGPWEFWGERHWWALRHVILPRADIKTSTERFSDLAQVVQWVRGWSGRAQVPSQLQRKPLARA